MPKPGEISDLEAFEAALRLTATTRAAQRRYFKTRDQGELIAARTLEKQLDNVLLELGIEELP
jgi:hypothetical protein